MGIPDSNTRQSALEGALLRCGVLKKAKSSELCSKQTPELVDYAQRLQMLLFVAMLMLVAHRNAR
jgi:hypothetical protein